jgi:hypothetical protein
VLSIDGSEEVTIIGISGGFGVKATIKAGDNPTAWSITIDGIVFIGSQREGIIPANAIETVNIPFIIGFGMVDITVIADYQKKMVSAFILGPFVLSLKEVE